MPRFKEPGPTNERNETLTNVLLKKIPKKYFESITFERSYPIPKKRKNER